MIVHDGMYNVKYKQPETLHELVLFEPIRQIRINPMPFKVTSLFDFGPLKIVQFTGKLYKLAG